MHYILLDFALNFGKQKLNVLKIDEMKQVTLEQKIEQKKEKINKEKEEEDILKAEMFNDNTNSDLVDTSFLGDTDTFSTPYINSDNFAELLPEDEKGNIIDKTIDEEQGPSFLENIKNKLIIATEKNKIVEEEIKETNSTPTIIDNLKNKIEEKEKEKREKEIKEKEEQIDNLIQNEKKQEETKKEIVKEDDTKKKEISNNNVINDDIESTFPTKKVEEPKKNETKKIEIKKEEPKKEEKKEEIIISNEPKVKENVISSKNEIIAEEPEKKGLLSNIKSTISNVINKATNSIDNEEEPEQLTIKGTLTEAELEQALKEQINSEYKELLNKENYSNFETIEYKEDPKYKQFLDEKEINILNLPEKILVPNIIPRKKEIISWKREVPPELLEPRNKQNSHIPKILRLRDEDDVIAKIIEYGMLPEFRAFIEKYENPNLIMDSQYSLLTYSIKNKQLKLVEYLIHIGANINMQDDRHETPLFMALRNDDMNLTKLLVEAGADIEAKDILERTPLIYCIEKNHQALGIYLIEQGADLYARNSVGEETLSMSIRYGRHLIRQKITEVLLKKREEKYDSM